VIACQKFGNFGFLNERKKVKGSQQCLNGLKIMLLYANVTVKAVIDAIFTNE
jgi:hypothetical protein